MPEDGQYVQVYYNLHRHCLSVQNRKRKVIGYVDRAVLLDAEFYVSEAGRQRVLREKCKNVHAKIRGTWSTTTPSTEGMRIVRYNPYLFPTFVYADTEEPVHNASVVVVEGDKVYVRENAECLSEPK